MGTRSTLLRTVAAAAAALLLLVPGPSAAPCEDGFDARLLLVRADPQLDFWSRTPRGSAPDVVTISRIHPNDQFMPLVVMQRLGDAGGGRGRITLDVSVLGADGRTQVLGEGIVAWDAPLPAAGVVVLSQAVFSLGFDEEEALGALQVIVDVHDHASGRSVRCEEELQLVPWTYGAIPADREAFGAWMNGYYAAPDPGEAVRAYLEFGSLRDARSADWDHPGLHFFRTVFLQCPWLLPHLAARFPESSTAQRAKIVALLQLTGQDELLSTLPFADADEERSIREELATLAPPPDPYGPLVHATQLDLLWAEYLATGRYAPVRQVVAALSLAPFEKPLPKGKPPRTEAEKADLMKNVLFRAARWSLESNIEQHELVRNYARHMLESDSLGKDERAVLQALVATPPMRSDRHAR